MTHEFAQSRTWQLLSLLADGEFHSGEMLASQLGVSRASVFNALAVVGDYGVVLQRIRGRGYRLAQPWQRLTSQDVSACLGEDANKFLIEIMPQATSSNSMLLQRASSGAPSGSVLAVELQTAGRGRMGRVWHAGLGNALTFSLLWRFDCALHALSGLSLAVGVAVVRVLRRFEARDVQLKWPNDILTPSGKLGGVLIEAQGDMLGPSAVVIGIGLNCTVPETLLNKIDQSVDCLSAICPKMPARSHLLAELLRELSDVLEQFEQHGFSALREEWESYHFYRNQTVQVAMADGVLMHGIARGVTVSGELCLETPQGIKQVNSGEVGVPLP